MVSLQFRFLDFIIKVRAEFWNRGCRKEILLLRDDLPSDLESGVECLEYLGYGSTEDSSTVKLLMIPLNP